MFCHRAFTIVIIISYNMCYCLNKNASHSHQAHRSLTTHLSHYWLIPLLIKFILYKFYKASPCFYQKARSGIYWRPRACAQTTKGSMLLRQSQAGGKGVVLKVAAPTPRFSGKGKLSDYQIISLCCREANNSI